MPTPVRPGAQLTNGRAAAARSAASTPQRGSGLMRAARRWNSCAIGSGWPSRCSGRLILMLTFGYGISFDVENLPFAVLDQDHSAGQPPTDRKLRRLALLPRTAPICAARTRSTSGCARASLRLAIEHPARLRPRPAFSGRRPEVAFWLDGAMPFRAETDRGYVTGPLISNMPASLRAGRTRSDREPRSLNSRPASATTRTSAASTRCVPGVDHADADLDPGHADRARRGAREGDTARSPIFASTPSAGEFLFGKQLPYVLIGFKLHLPRRAARLAFGVPLKGSLAALGLPACSMSSPRPLLASWFRLHAHADRRDLCDRDHRYGAGDQFLRLSLPVAALDSAGRFIGLGFPSLWFQNISLGTFSKGAIRRLLSRVSLVVRIRRRLSRGREPAPASRTPDMRRWLSNVFRLG